MIKIRDKITYKDLSWPLKVAVVAGWALTVIYGLAFIIGVLAGLGL